MIPLTQALQVAFVEERAGVCVYSGEVAKEWSFHAPQGGYVLGLLVSACLSTRVQTSHPDLIHLTGHFLRVAAFRSFEVHVRTLRKGSKYSNLSAELVQDKEVKISAQFIFGTLPAKITNDSYLTLLPPSPYARRMPLHMHPSVAQVTPMIPGANFHTVIKWAEDKTIRERNRALARGGNPIGGGGLEWGAWIELLAPEDTLDVALLPFLADLFKNAVDLLPRDPKQRRLWDPTMVLSLEYKAKIPNDPNISRRTVGVYSCVRFMHEGRQDVYLEIWTSPSQIGQGADEGEWRENQICLAVSHQMQVSITESVNERKISLAESKL